MSKTMKKEITILAILLLTGQAFAQQTPLFQQIGSRPKGLTNLAEPTEAIDSFLGQDKSGPYVLSWKNFVYSPSSPVWVTIDGSVLRTTEYNLNVEKGEITFKNIVKRTQIVNVKYGYFPETSTKNPNPALTAPLTVKLASSSFSGLTFTAVNAQNLSSAPSMVLGHTLNTRGFTSNYYANPTGKGTDIQDAIKLGYTLGKTNSFTANYEKADKGFSSLAKNFGTLDAAEKTNLNGKYSIAKNSNLSFNNTAFKSLNSAVENNNTSAQFSMAGGKNQPSFNYLFADNSGTDAKNVKTSNYNQNASFNSKVGQGDFIYRNVQNDSTTNTTRSVNNQEILSFKTNQFSAGRVNDYKVDPKAGTIDSTTDSLNYNTKILGGSANFSSTQNNSIIHNKEIKNDQNVFGFILKSNKSGFSGLTLNRSENTTISGANETNVANNKVSIGFKTLSYNSNMVVSETNNQVRKDVIDETLSLSLPTRKNAPALTYSSVDAIKRNDKGILVGSSNDLTSFNHTLSGLQLGYRFGQTTTYSPDGRVASVDNSTGNLSTKIGRGIFTSENANNQITTNDNKLVNQDVSKFNYSITQNKSMPGLELERIDFNSSQDTNSLNTLSDKIKLTSKIGSASLNAASFVSSTDNNNKQNETLANSINLNTPIWGQSSLNVNLSSNMNSSPIGDEARTGLGISFAPSRLFSFATEQTDSRLINSGQLMNFANNNKFSLNYNSPGTTIQTAINTIETNISTTEILDYRAVLGNNKTLFQIDSIVRMRDSTDNNTNLNKDTTQTSVSINTSKNLKLNGSYVLNPDDATRPGLTVPVERRSLGLNAKLGHFDLNGSYSSIEHLPGTQADVLAKAGGFNLYGESGIKLGYKVGSTSFYSEMRDQFFFGSNLKGINTYSLGFTQNRGDKFNFSLSGTVIQNRNNSNVSQDFRAEAKLGVKF